MDIMHLLDRLEAVLTSGARIPLSGKTVVDEHECLDIIDQLRASIPEEVKQARRLQSERDRILQDAEGQAARTVAHAQERAMDLVQQHELVREAEVRARQIVEDAESDAQSRMEESDRYAAETLADLDAQLSEVMAVVRNGIRALRKDRRDGEPE